MNTKVDAVFTQRSNMDGLTAREISQLLAVLKLAKDDEVRPVFVKGDSAFAFGFIRNRVVVDTLGGKIDDDMPFKCELLAVVNNMNLESPDKIYDFAGVNTFMDYYLEEDFPDWLKDSIAGMQRAWKRLDSGEEYFRWDCDFCNLQTDINNAEVNCIIGTEQAWYLRTKYLRIERC